MEQRSTLAINNAFDVSELWEGGEVEGLGGVASGGPGVHVIVGLENGP